MSRAHRPADGDVLHYGGDTTVARQPTAEEAEVLAILGWHTGALRQRLTVDEWAVVDRLVARLAAPG